MGRLPENLRSLVTQLYVDSNKSTIEIAEVLLKDYSLAITPRSLQRLLVSLGVIRTKKQAFRNAILYNRVHWRYKDPRNKVKRPFISHRLRYRILKRDNFKCVTCGSTAENAVLEVDHLVPLCKFGATSEQNLRTLCHQCNVGKAIEEVER